MFSFILSKMPLMFYGLATEELTAWLSRESLTDANLRTLPAKHYSTFLKSLYKRQNYTLLLHLGIYTGILSLRCQYIMQLFLASQYFSPPPIINFVEQHSS